LEFLSTSFFSSLLSIIIIDLVIAGDNAIIIGLIVKNLPKEQQLKAIFWGTMGAITFRSLATIIVVRLLEVPGLLLIGGLTLIWISYNLLTVPDKDNRNADTKNTLGAAIRTIIITDIVISIDNVLAVAGASFGNFHLVVIGLLISIPIVIGGSTLFLKLANQFPIIIYIGSGVIAWTSAKMIIDEPILKAYFTNPFFRWGVVLIIIIGVLLAWKIKNKKQQQEEKIKEEQLEIIKDHI
jgi:YjbE family integral membrane protein